jgi:periplasmic divalent cation tolerance protein
MTQNDADLVIVLTTVPQDLDTDKLIQHLFEQRLVACVNVLPGMRSVYRWRGAVESAEERQLIIKTRRGCVPALEAALTAVHPYEVPEFLVLAVSGGSDAYLTWLRTEADPPRADGD